MTITGSSFTASEGANNFETSLCAKKLHFLKNVFTFKGEKKQKPIGVLIGLHKLSLTEWVPIIMESIK